MHPHHPAGVFFCCWKTCDFFFFLCCVFSPGIVTICILALLLCRSMRFLESSSRNFRRETPLGIMSRSIPTQAECDLAASVYWKSHHGTREGGRWIQDRKDLSSRHSQEPGGLVGRGRNSSGTPDGRHSSCLFRRL